MTFVGKILVILLMIFSVCFLALTTVTFSTATNWKKETEKQRAALAKTQQELQTAKASEATAQDEAKKQVDKLTGDIAALNAQIQDLSKRSEQLEREKTDAVTRIETIQQNMVIAQEEAETRRKEVEQLRGTLAGVEKQANGLKIEQTDLNTTIRELETERGALRSEKRTLLDNVNAYASFLAERNIDFDITRVKRLQTLPDVEGEVTRVDPTNRTLEISIGSDDGLVRGHTLEIYRTDPSPEYIGKVQILETDPDRAVARVIGQTYQGKKIREGDRVSSKIRPRG